MGQTDGSRQAITIRGGTTTVQCIKCGALMVLAHVERSGTDELWDASVEIRRNLNDLQEGNLNDLQEIVRRLRKKGKVKDLCGFRTEIHHG
jgi:hypothetical protein